MKRIWLLGISILVLGGLLTGLCGCSTAETAVSTSAVLEEKIRAELTPVAVTERFYSWYLDYAGQSGSNEMRNPLVDGTYRSSVWLTPAMIEEVDAALASFAQGGYDPFLMAQDVPQRFTVEEYFDNGQEASVVVHAIWEGSLPHNLQVELVRQNGVWQINRIRQGNPMTPDGVTKLFYEWYIGHRNPETGEMEPILYQTSAYLSDSFKEEVAATYASFGDKGSYDPILLAQDIPVSVAVQETAVNGSSATVKLLRYWGGNPDPSPMEVILQRINGRWLINGVRPAETAVPFPLTSPAEPVAGQDPAAVVQSFYTWYLGYIGDDSLRGEQNPLRDGAYRSSKHLSPAFIARLDEHAGNYDTQGFDLILMSAYVPDRFEVSEATILDRQARVPVRRNWPGIEKWLPLYVYLEEANGRWLINHISLVMEAAPDVILDTEMAPAEVVEAFYVWYLSRLGNPAAGYATSPMAEKSYRESPYLTANCINRIDELVRQNEAAYGYMAYDPFLTAQADPMSFHTDGTFVHPLPLQNGLEATVLVRSGFYNSHGLLITLRQVKGLWQIEQIDGIDSPMTAATAFYTWWLGYRNQQTGERQDRPVDYPASGFLTDGMVQRIAELNASFEGGGLDPFLRAQDFPHVFSVLAGPEANSVQVNFAFLDEDREPYNSWDLILRFTESGGAWLIDDIIGRNGAEATTAAAGWQQLRSEAQDLILSFPADWVAQELDYAVQGMPDDWPVVAGWQLMPAPVAADLAAQSGPPDPNAPAVIPPFQLEIVIGDQSAFDRVYVAPLASESVFFGENRFLMQRQDYGGVRYVYRPPLRQDAWIVVTDWLTDFPGREAQSETVAGILPYILASIGQTE